MTKEEGLGCGDPFSDIRTEYATTRNMAVMKVADISEFATEKYRRERVELRI
jgi:hypothetical protein